MCPPDVLARLALPDTYAEEQLLELEGLFWKYRDADGNLKAPNELSSPINDL